MKHRLFLLATATLALAMFNSCGKDEEPEPYVEPCPTASFTVSTNGYWDVTLTDNSTNAYSYSIDWGDGNTSDYWYAYHDYATSGTYTITLKVKNSSGACSDVASRSVVVTHSSPSPTPTPSNPTQVKINSLMLNRFPEYPSSGNWDPLDNKPEVYFTITDGNGTQVFYTSAIKTGGISNDDCPTTFGSINYTIYNLTATYHFNFYDKDDYDSDDLMASCEWTPSLENNNYATSYLWSNYYVGISFTLKLTWYSSKGKALYSKQATFEDGNLVSDDPELQALFGPQQ